VFEEIVINQCSPTMAGLKTGNMFSYQMQSKAELLSSIRKLNKILVKRKVRLILLKYDGKRALLYMYRPDFLKRDLSEKLALKILSEKHYPLESPEHCITELIKRINNNSEFPHEIGLFLGYPPVDVWGFIKNKAQREKCVGTWKVYGDVNAAQKKFLQYKKCTNYYRKCFQKYNSLDQLIVAV